MGKRHEDSLASFPRSLVMLYAASLVICLLFGGLPDSDGSMERHLARSLAPNLMAVAFALLICYYSQRHAAASARSRGMPARDAAEEELSAGMGPGGFLPIYSFWVTEDLGWAWGALFLGVFALYIVHLLLRWRRYMSLPAEAG